MSSFYVLNNYTLLVLSVTVYFKFYFCFISVFVVNNVFLEHEHLTMHNFVDNLGIYPLKGSPCPSVFESDV